jgi:hypothetical protein
VRRKKEEKGTPMSHAYQVKGSTINSKLAFVAERFGANARAELEKELADAGAPKFFDSGWYPYAQYCDLLRRIADNQYAGNITRLEEAGEYSAAKALETTYSAFAKRGDFIGFLNHISMLHKMFYSEGRTEVEVMAGGKSCEIRHRDKPEFAEEDLHVALGFYRGSARLHGINKMSGRYFSDALGVTFVLDWTEQGSGAVSAAEPSIVG